MDKQPLLNQLNIIHANTFTLYVKTLNYHWHVSGESFFALHKLFEEQYTSLFNAIDDIAERIVTMGGHAPATMQEILSLTTLQEGNSENTTQNMIHELEQNTICLPMPVTI